MYSNYGIRGSGSEFYSSTLFVVVWKYVYILIAIWNSSTGSETLQKIRIFFFFYQREKTVYCFLLYVVSSSFELGVIALLIQQQLQLQCFSKNPRESQAISPLSEKRWPGSPR